MNTRRCNNKLQKKMLAILSALLMLLWPVGVSALDPTDGTDAKQDLDKDGLDTRGEYNYGTDPNNPDTDSDLVEDGWEVHFRIVWLEKNPDASEPRPLNPTETDAGSISADAISNSKSNIKVLYGLRDSDISEINDPDRDGWNNLHEFLVGTDPTNLNTDGDSINDAEDPEPLIPESTGVIEDGGFSDGQKQISKQISKSETSFIKIISK